MTTRVRSSFYRTPPIRPGKMHVYEKKMLRNKHICVTHPFMTLSPKREMMLIIIRIIIEWEVADSYSFAGIFIIFSYEWELPFHMSLSAQYTAAVCFVNLKLESALVTGSGAIIISRSEKTWFLHATVCRLVHHHNSIKNKVKSKQHYFEQK